MSDYTGYLQPIGKSLADDAALAGRDPASFQGAAGVLLTGGTTGSLTGQLLSGASRAVAVTRQALYAGGDRVLGAPAPRTLSPEEATERFGVPGELSFEKPVAEDDAAFRHAAKVDEVGRRDVLSRSTIAPLTSFGLSLGGGLIDPAGMALNFVPVVGEGRVLTTLGYAAEGAAAASRAQALGRGVVAGALGGLQGSAIGEGLTYGIAHGLEGRDYTAADAAQGLAVGTVLGSAAHGVLSAAGWRAPAVRTPAASAAVGDLARRIETLGERSRQGQVSPKGAFGVMQLMPETAARLAEAHGIDPALARTDAAVNRRLGELHIGQLLHRFGGDEVLASAAYNAGEGRLEGYTDKDGVHHAGWLKDIGDPRKGEISSADFAARIPFRETRDYVARVTGGDGRAAPGRAAGAEGAAPAEAAPPAAEPRFDPVPAEVSALDETARQGALAAAVRDLADDRPVDLGELHAAELASGGGPRPELDEPGGGPALAARFDREDTAYTVRGTAVPVRYAVAELRDLVTSHSDELVRNPDFPEALQPRDRERAGSQARLLRLEREFRPALLMDSPDAASGAPIVSGDGVVESGNGRTIVLRRAAETGGALYDGYRAELERHGYDTKGMSQPVLVRVRSDPLSGSDRVRLSREMNAPVTERMGDVEQAFADAGAITDDDLALHAGGGEPTSAANRAFARRFADTAAAGDENLIVDPATRGLSQAGVRRVRAALLARAYGDRDLVYAAHEAADARVRGLADALTTAAPEWAGMRAAAARGELAPGLDLTDSLTSAVALVRQAREGRQDLKLLVEGLRGQHELFGGEALSTETEALLRLFFRDEDFRQARSTEIVSDALADYARRAREVPPGPTLFGAPPDAQEVFASVYRKWTEDPTGARARRAIAETPAANGTDDGAVAPVADLLAGGGPAGERAGAGVRDAGVAGAGDAARTAGQTAGQPDRLSASREAVRAALADPEVKALAEDTARLVAALGDEAPTATRPLEVAAEAVRAAAFCLAEG